MANLLADLAAALADGGIETPPPGWQTARELGESSGYASSHSQRIIAEAVAAGMLECRKFRVRCGSRVYPVPHYRRPA
jgi:hypothetical protein